MTVWYIDEIISDSARQNHAGSKARDDVAWFCKQFGYKSSSIYVDEAIWTSRKLLDRVRVKFQTTVHAAWKSALSVASPGDSIVVQYPLIYPCDKLAKDFQGLRSKGIRIVLLVHDLEIARLSLLESKDNISYDKNSEAALLDSCSAVIVHNQKMKQLVEKEVPNLARRIVSLELFDYAVPSTAASPMRIEKQQPVIIAGNLSPEKTGYLAQLPEDVAFNLYGPNYVPQESGTTNYMGSFPPDQLIENLEGSFGLVWDGPSAQSCRGVFGEYLRVNNPHKVSLYLSNGIPVVIWDQAALATLVKQENVGLCVSSLYDLRQHLEALSEDDYKTMRLNAQKMSRALREGKHLEIAIAAALALPA